MYTEYICTHYKDPERRIIIDGIIGGFLETGDQRESTFQKWFSAAILVGGVDDFAKDTVYDFVSDKVKDFLVDAGQFAKDRVDDAVDIAEDMSKKIYETGAKIASGISSIGNGIASLLHLNEAYDKDRIEINITKLYETAEVYKSCRTELEDMLKELSTGMENLKAHWEGDAQKSYFTNAFPQFQESMKKHISMMAFLEKELAGIADKFGGLDIELKSRLA